MEDITLRALNVLKSVDKILCEDTRVTKNLLNKYDIHVPTMSYHANSSTLKHDAILKLLEDGENLALVSDAGTPTLSDPGVMLVKQVREFLPDVEIIPIPGASALLSALVVTGFSSAQFLYLGFIPHKKGRKTMFKEIGETDRTVVFYESPHRIEKTLESLVKYLEPGRKVAVCRELTKMFEQFVIGTPAEVEQYFKDNKDKIRGEFVVVVDER